MDGHDHDQNDSNMTAFLHLTHLITLVLIRMQSYDQEDGDGLLNTFKQLVMEMLMIKMILVIVKLLYCFIWFRQRAN